MAHYFLHFRAGTGTILDPEGRAYLDLDEAREEAIAAAKDFVVDMIYANRTIAGQAVEITDENGDVLDSVLLLSVLRLG